MLNRLRNRVYGPADKAVIALVAVVLVAALTFVAVTSFGGDDCGEGLEEAGGECVGVTAQALPTDDPVLRGLIEAVARENARVERDGKEPSDGKAPVPYVRLALMMPFAADATSAMTLDQIRRAVAGAHVGQLAANAEAGPHVQLLFANVGKDLKQSGPVIDRLSGMTDDEPPLLGTLGMPSSTTQSRQAIDVLSRHRIPSVGPVITSANMNAKYFFKTSPSNELFAQALREHLAGIPGEHKGYLIADSRDQDVYSQNLRGVWLRYFEKDYGLGLLRQAYYLGVTGDEEGLPRRFSSAAEKICVTGADTIFFAGRDHDLPHLVARMANEPSCRGAKPMRLVKIGIGLDPLLTTRDVTGQLQDANITLVNAASVDPRWWERGERAPSGLDGFMKRFRPLERQHKLGDRPLDDGYSIMYHDAFKVLGQALDKAFSDLNDGRKGGDEVLPTKDDIYNTMIDMGVVPTGNGAGCITCVQGASGTFGFDDTPQTSKWPVCKAVPVIEFPRPAADPKAKAREDSRTFDEVLGKACP